MKRRDFLKLVSASIVSKFLPRIEPKNEWVESTDCECPDCIEGESIVWRFGDVERIQVPHPTECGKFITVAQIKERNDNTPSLGAD